MEFPSYDIELSLKEEGYKKIVGVDEVGRGSAFGPVVASAVHIPPSSIEYFTGKVNDSKKLSPKRRQAICYDIIDRCEFGIGSISNVVIDQINIFEATKLAMYKALDSITEIDYVLVDGNITLEQLTVAQRSIIKGDNLSISIAAASIIAKVLRDSLMIELHDKYPVYGIDKNKGYLTSKHIEALKKYGPSDLHRLTFNKVVV